MNSFMEQFGPMRYVHSRRSGLITFGGGGGGGPSLADIKTAVTEYGDPKFDTTFGNQGDIVDDIDDALDDTLARIGTSEDNITGEFDALSGDIGDVGTDVTGISGDLTRGLSSIDRRFDDVDSDAGDNFADLTSDIAGEGADTRSNIRERIDTQDVDLGRAFTDINDQVIDSEGNLTDQASKYFADLVSQMGDNRDTITGNQETNANAIKEQVGDFDDRTTSTLDTLGTDMRTNQGNIQDAVDTGNTQGTEYFNTLSEGQTGISDDLGGLQSDLTSFTGDYDADTTLANRARNDLASALGITQQELGEDIQETGGRNVEEVNEAERNLDAAITSSGADTASALNTGLAGVSSDIGATARDLSAGIDATTEEQVAARNEFMSGLGTMEALVNSETSAIDNQMKANFTAMTTSFDSNGKLISDDMNAMGNRVKRAIDGNGNLIVSEFDEAGVRISQNGYDINSIMASMSSIDDSSIADTGLLTAPVNRSPYARTQR